MQLLRITQPGPFGLEVGAHYALDDEAAGIYLLTLAATAVNTLDLPRRLPSDPECKRLLIVRAGGFGDLLFLTPSLIRLRALRPDLHIGVACVPSYHAALADPALTDVDRVQYPVPEADLAGWDSIIALENLVEQDNNHSACEIFAAALGLLDFAAYDPSKPPFSLQPVYSVPAAAREIAAQDWPTYKAGAPRIGIQVEATARCRTYPINLLAQTIDRLIALPSRPHVFLFGSPSDQRADPHPQITSLPCHQPPPTFAESCAILSTMDVVIAPDSSLCHIAGALGLPTVALYGPFHWRQRTKHSPSVHALQGSAECAPCHHHVKAWGHWPPGKPCAKRNYCLAMASITPERIVQQTKRALANHQHEPNRP